MSHRPRSSDVGCLWESSTVLDDVAATVEDHGRWLGPDLRPSVTEQTNPAAAMDAVIRDAYVAGAGPRGLLRPDAELHRSLTDFLR